MRFLRLALGDIFTRGRDPWDSLSNYCTVTPMALEHTTIVLIDKDDFGTVRGRQIVYSRPADRPWGFVPRCGKKDCPSRLGEAYGKATNRQEPHRWMRMTCQICRFHSGWIKRPEWITPIRNHSYYFCTPWPVTSKMEEEALGIGEQRLGIMHSDDKPPARKDLDEEPAIKRPRPT